MTARPGDWWVYLLEREDGSWYTGISTDPRRRFEQHRTHKGGARANKISEPHHLVCLEFAGPYPKALRREAQIKGLTKAKKRVYAADPVKLDWPDKNAPWMHADRARASKRKKGVFQVDLRPG